MGAWALAVELSGFVGAALFALLHWARFAGILRLFRVVAPRWKRYACVVCRTLFASCRALARLNFVHVHCAPGIAAGPRFHVGAAVLAP